MGRALRWLGVIGVVAALAAVGIAGYVWTTTSVDTIGRLTFSEPLAIAPLAQSRFDADGVRVFELTARSGTSEFLPGTSAKTWGFNGAYLGPTLRAQGGERVRINVPQPKSDVAHDARATRGRAPPARRLGVRCEARPEPI